MFCNVTLIGMDNLFFLSDQNIRQRIVQSLRSFFTVLAPCYIYKNTIQDLGDNQCKTLVNKWTLYVDNGSNWCKSGSFVVVNCFLYQSLVYIHLEHWLLNNYIPLRQFKTRMDREVIISNIRIIWLRMCLS